MSDNKLNWHGKEISAKMEKARESALKDAAEYILENANRRVPHDEGTLQSSGITSYHNGVAVISYNTPYAVRLHEHPEYNFQKGREGKWLENTLNAERAHIMSYIQDRIRNELG